MPSTVLYVEVIQSTTEELIMEQTTNEEEVFKKIYERAEAMRRGEEVKKETKALATQVGGNHYNTMKIQPMEYTMANNMNPLQHTAIKYISRYKAKGGVEDLEKAKHTIQLLIDWEKGHDS